MFIPDQTKNDLAELLADDRNLKKLKKSSNTNGRAPLSALSGGIGDLDFLDDGDGGCGDSGCHSRHDRRELQRNAAKAMSAMGKKPEKRSWRQMMVGIVLLLAMSGGIFTTLWSIVDYLTGASLFPFVDVKTQEADLKEIFFGGHPYVVYCQAGKSKLVPKLVIEGANLLPRGFSTVMLNCDDIIPASGTSVYERFNLDSKGIPAFVVANGEKPVQFNRESFYNSQYFAEFAKHQTTPKLKEVTNETQFRSFCTKKERCVAIGHKGKLSDSAKEAIEYANSYWRKQRVATIDTARYAIKLDAVLSASLEQQMKDGKTGKGYLSGLCLETSGEGGDPDIPPKAMVRRITEGEIYYFMKDCMGSSGLSEVKHVPSLEVKSGKKKTNEKKSKKADSPKKKAAPEPAPETGNQYADDGMEVEDIDD